MILLESVHEPFDFNDVFDSDIKAREQYLICINDHVDLNDLADELEADTGLSFKAKNIGDPVNGAIVSTKSPLTTESIGWCGQLIPKDVEHTCCIVYLYEKSKNRTVTDKKEVNNPFSRKSDIVRKRFTQSHRTGFARTIARKGFICHRRKE